MPDSRPGSGEERPTRQSLAKPDFGQGPKLALGVTEDDNVVLQQQQNTEFGSLEQMS